MKLLFITSTRIGDVIISTTVLNHVVEKYPSAQVTVACGDLPAALFEDLPQLHQLITVTKKKYAQHWFKLWRQTVTNSWDMAIDLRGSALTYCLMSRQRKIWRSNSTSKTRHEQLLDLLGTQDSVLPKIWIAPERQQKMRSLFPSKIPVIAIAPAANWLGKEWPQENYIQLLNQLTGPQGSYAGAKIAIFAAPHEYQRLEPLKQQLQDQLIDVSAYPHLLDVAALLKQCSLFIGNDSGLMHLAAAVGTPTLGLFGPSDDRLYRPTGLACDFVRTPESFEQLWGMVKAGNEAGLMDSLTVDMVLAKLGAFKDRKPHRMASQKSL